MVNMDIYSSRFYLAMTQSQCLMVIWRDDGLSTLCNSCSFACQQRVLKLFLASEYLRFEDGRDNLTMVNTDIYIYI